MLRPVLDTMQTMPQFVYLIPVIALVGLSRSARHHRRRHLRGSRRSSASPRRACATSTPRRWRRPVRWVPPASSSSSAVQLPLARKSLLVGVNQGVVLVLSMVVIAGLIGGGALGYDVVQGLSKGDLSQGLPAGIAIVCLGIMLDRISQPAGAQRRRVAPHRNATPDGPARNLHPEKRKQVTA